MPIFLKENSAKILIKYDGERDIKKYTVRLLYSDIKESFESYITSYYLKRVKPKEIVVPSYLDKELLSDVLEIKVSDTKAGTRKQIMDMVGQNAIKAMEDEFAKQQNKQSVLTKLQELLNGHKADVVMSDMAANTTGMHSIDHLRIMGLLEMAYDFALKVLNPNGVFIAKVFQGGTESKFLLQMKKDFAVVKHAKPDASRKDSSEIYVIAQGFKGHNESTTN